MIWEYGTVETKAKKVRETVVEFVHEAPGLSIMMLGVFIGFVGLWIGLGFQTALAVCLMVIGLVVLIGGIIVWEGNGGRK